jgi:hypothetical protein
MYLGVFPCLNIYSHLQGLEGHYLLQLHYITKKKKNWRTCTSISIRQAAVCEILSQVSTV